jgi:hypothetical protein
MDLDLVYHLGETTTTDDRSDPPSAADKAHIRRASSGYHTSDHPDEALSSPKEMYKWPCGKILARVITSSCIIDP